MHENIIDAHTKIADQLITTNGGKLLSIDRKYKYNQNITTCEIQCKYGHVWKTSIDALKQGRWCMSCRQSLDPEDVRILIENNNGTLVKDAMVGKVRKITIRCNIDGNVWTASLSSIKNKKSWCKICHNKSKVKQVDINIIKDFIASKNLRLLTSEGEITKWSRIKVYCDAHEKEWETTYAAMSSYNSGCKLCSHNIISNEELRKIVSEYNVEFIKRISGVSPVRNILLKCNKHNHGWTTNVAAIKIHDRWCSYCAREQRKTSYEKIKAMVEQKEGVLLSNDCSGSLTKIMVRCKNNHEWETYFDNINQGYWCPVCQSVHQKQLYEIIKELFPTHDVKYNQHPFEWLRDQSKLEIDIWAPELKLAIEYDGEQHFQIVKFGGSSITDEEAAKQFKRIQHRDSLKNALIFAHPDDVKHFVRFSYKDTITKALVTERLKASGLNI